MRGDGRISSPTTWVIFCFPPPFVDPIWLLSALLRPSSDTICPYLLSPLTLSDNIRQSLSQRETLHRHEVHPNEGTHRRSAKTPRIRCPDSSAASRVDPNGSTGQKKGPGISRGPAAIITSDSEQYSASPSGCGPARQPRIATIALSFGIPQSSHAERNCAIDGYWVWLSGGFCPLKGAASTTWSE